MRHYYNLVAGMPDLSPDDAKLTFTVADFKADYWPQLSASDRKLVTLFFLKYDHRNLLAFLEKGEDAPFDERAMYSRQDLAEAVEKVKIGDEQGRKLPAYFYDFISTYSELEEIQERLPEDVLSAAYYNYAGSFKNRFTADWFGFSRNVNNIMIALTGRKYGFAAAPYLVGQDEVTEALATSGARDFGLTAELDYMEDVMRIHDMTDPVEKERKLDLLKWEWLENHTFFCYFSIERLFAFLVQLDIIERWTSIDKERGGKVFRDLVEHLKNEVEIPQEFKK
ncbi:MAG: DUF2764 domain-containing protein [Paraprevotella sp.]|nr:DUF2764 domain-containing protein [Paraprevotella sp.]